jgi:[acyl-carrier-protein] S-malonyltransferase
MPEVNKIAYIFPGQGSQKVGMGKDLYDGCKNARSVFDEADKVLGFPLSRLCFEGPEEELRQTINAQPALVTMSYACYKAAISRIDKSRISGPAYLAGHSLGEYTALAVGGVLDFSSAVFLARERGRLMQEAGANTPGAMAAVLGIGEAEVTALCQATGTWLANINCPGQLVISGTKENIEKAVALAKSKGALKVMQPAADGLSAIIAKASFNNPSIPVIANTSAQPLTDTKAIIGELLQQLTHSVRWQQSIEYMINNGTTVFIEIGAGNVLSGLIKRINKSVKTLNISSSHELGNIAGE